MLAKGSRDIEHAEFSICPVCGYAVVGEAPERCPICGVKRERFRKF